MKKRPTLRICDVDLEEQDVSTYIYAVNLTKEIWNLLESWDGFTEYIERFALMGLTSWIDFCLAQL